MNKHISINIGGIIFHVEEEAFEKLKSYLSKINKYFSSYSGSDEIMSDIESRIAEFFLNRLDDKEYITLEDVEDLQASMGTVSEWADADEYAQLREEVETAGEYTYQGEESKKLYRDEQRRLIGGVASGIAHYFSIDPLWTRLFFLLFFFDFSSFSSVTGVAILAYVILWAIVPASYNLEDNDKVRRLFRDSENRVLGGVASGVAAYFRVQPTLVRVIFVLSNLLGGLGILSYFILWAITPVAKSLTERMQMKGEPITLENIEEQIKQRFQLNDGEEESPLVKALLLPLRLLSNALERLNNDVDHTRVLQKGGHLLLFIVGSTMTLASTVASLAMFSVVGAYFGLGHALVDTNTVYIDNIPVSLVQATIPASTVLFTFLTGWVPVAFMGIAGMSIASRRIVTKSFINWGLLGLWIVGIVGTGLTIPMVASQFRSKGVHKQMHTIEASYPEAFRILVKDDRAFEQGQFNRVQLKVLGHNEPNIQLVQKFSASGCSRQVAIESASTIDYDFELRDSTLILNPSFGIDTNKPFRKQSVWMELYVPYGKEFIMSEEVGWIIRNTLHRHGYTVHDLGMKNRWIYTEEEGLRCITCKNGHSSIEDIHTTTSQHGNEHIKSMALSTEISAIRLSGIGSVEIEEGAKASLQIQGYANGIDMVDIRTGDESISIENEASNQLQIKVTLPRLEQLRVDGPMAVQLGDLHQERMELRLSEGARLNGSLFVKSIEVRMKEGASMEVSGAAESARIIAKEGASVHAQKWNVENMEVVAKEGAAVYIGKVNKLKKKLAEGARVIQVDED